MNKLQLSWKPFFNKMQERYCHHFVVADEDCWFSFIEEEGRLHCTTRVWQMTDEMKTPQLIEEIENLLPRLSLITKIGKEIEGAEIQIFPDSDFDVIEISIPNIYPVPPYFEDDEQNVFIPDMEGLKQFAIDGDWEGIEGLAGDIGIDPEDFLNCWFMIVHGRMYLKEE